MTFLYILYYFKIKIYTFYIFFSFFEFKKCPLLMLFIYIFLWDIIFCFFILYSFIFIINSRSIALFIRFFNLFLTFIIKSQKVLFLQEFYQRFTELQFSLRLRCGALTRWSAAYAAPLLMIRRSAHQEWGGLIFMQAWIIPPIPDGWTVTKL